MWFFLSPYQPATLNDDSIIKSSNVQKLLGVTIHSNFTFEEHINSLCQKFCSKIILLVYNFQFSYCTQSGCAIVEL